MLPTIKTDQGVLSYSDHLQLSTLRYYKSGSSTDILSLAYDYGAKRMKQLGQSIRTVLDLVRGVLTRRDIAWSLGQVLPVKNESGA